MKNPKILIAGCGLGGMLTALAFAEKNIPVHIVEEKNTKSKNFFSDIRPTALTYSSIKFFDQIGIWEYIKEIATAINDIYVLDNKQTQILHFMSDIINNKMGYIVTNKNFKKCLFELCRKSDSINIDDNINYKVIDNSQSQCKVEIDRKLHEYDLVIACNGHKSKIVNRYFSKKIEHYYRQYAITFIVHHEKNHEGTAVEHFLQKGPFAILPLQSQNESSVVWTMSDNIHSAISKLQNDELTYLVQQNFGEFLGSVKIISDVASFPLKAYCTNQYYNNSIVLVADTAHVVHPLAGQGLNQGMKDIKALTKLIATHSLNKKTLSTYQNMRQKDNEHMLELTDMTNRIFLNRISLKARQIGFLAIEKIPILKKLIVKYAMGQR